MEEPSFVTCPKCGNEKSLLLYRDEFPCAHCYGAVKLDYCRCPSCSYSYRLCNGELLDGHTILEEDLEDLAKELESALTEEAPLWVADDDNCISSHLVSCIRCNSPRAYRETNTSYVCPDCDFAWEILGHE